MSIQYRFFTIPAAQCNEAADELNSFLRSVRVLTVSKEFVQMPGGASWHLAVEYLDGAKDTARIPARQGKAKVDYREVLSQEDFALFVKLREWRKETAAAEAVPVYTLFTNEQLARIAGGWVRTKKELAAIEGVGEARISKYGDAVLALVAGEKERINETSGQPVSPNSRS